MLLEISKISNEDEQLAYSKKDPMLSIAAFEAINSQAVLVFSMHELSDNTAETVTSTIQILKKHDVYTSSSRASVKSPLNLSLN